MADNIVLFETKVYPWEGVPYLATKRKVKLIITNEEDIPINCWSKLAFIFAAEFVTA